MRASNVNVNLLLAEAGPEDLLDSMDWVNDKDKKLKTIIAGFDKYFGPQTNEIMTRHQF